PLLLGDPDRPLSRGGDRRRDSRDRRARPPAERLLLTRRGRVAWPRQGPGRRPQERTPAPGGPRSLPGERRAPPERFRRRGDEEAGERDPQSDPAPCHPALPSWANPRPSGLSRAVHGPVYRSLSSEGLFRGIRHGLDDGHPPALTIATIRRFGSA